MSSHLHYFGMANGCTAVALPFPLEQVMEQWGQLRLCMVRELPPPFIRDEWGYLIAFLDRENLQGAFTQSFGDPVATMTGPIRIMERPRGLVAVWLPNNVSLLGPLTMVLLSLTGNPIWLKGGTQSEDMSGAFLAFARQRLPSGPLKKFLIEQVRHDVFDREDPRHREMAAKAQMRIVFGSDAAAEAIHDLPHPVGSVGFSFIDRRSEAWIEKGATTDALLRDLIKVFAIYGQAGCTSPRRVVLLVNCPSEAVDLRDRLANLWPHVVQRQPAMHIASENIMAWQWAAALGWDARLTQQHGAVLAAGRIEFPEFNASMCLRIVSGSAEQALESLPRNIQTVGYGLAHPGQPAWLDLLAHSGIKRLVPIPKMHQFGPVWDGHGFWRQAFEEIEIG